MRLGGFEASVKVDDVALDEYAVEISKEGKRATCWIPSQEGKVGGVTGPRAWADTLIIHSFQAFNIYWTDIRDRRTATSGYPRVDGVEIGSGKIIRPDHGPFRSRFNHSHKSYIRTSKTAIRSLKFAIVELTGACASFSVAFNRN